MELTPFGTLHARRDDGEGETGDGIEVVERLRAVLGIVRLDGLARMLARHSAEGYAERGGGRAVRWIEKEVDEWIRERIAESRDGAAGDKSAAAVAQGVWGCRWRSPHTAPGQRRPPWETASIRVVEGWCGRGSSRH